MRIKWTLYDTVEEDAEQNLDATTNANDKNKNECTR